MDTPSNFFFQILLYTCTKKNVRTTIPPTPVREKKMACVNKITPLPEKHNWIIPVVINSLHEGGFFFYNRLIFLPFF